MEERRRFQRFSVYKPFQYKRKDSFPRDSSITLNLSEDGALISSRKPMQVDENLMVRMFVGKSDVMVKAKVVHVQSEEHSGLYNIGIQFLQKSADFVKHFYEEMDLLASYQARYFQDTGRPISLAEASMKWYQNSPIWG